MSFEFFISKHVIKNKSQNKKISEPIVRVSVISIALAIVVNLITLSIVTGFQNEIREKITGFNAPLYISKTGSTSIYESDPIYKNSKIKDRITNLEGVAGINLVSFKPVLLQSSKFSDTLKLISGKDSLIQRQEISGLIMKGVDENYDWGFIKKQLKKGRLPKYNNSSVSNEILISEKICTNLNYKLADEIVCFYVKNQPVSRRYKIVGIFNTGLEEYDKKILFCDLREVQRMNDYGISSSIEVDDTLQNSKALLLKAQINGSKTNLLFDWGKGPDIYSGVYLTDLRDTTIRLVVYELNYQNNKSVALDTSYLKITVDKPMLTKELNCQKTGFLNKIEVSANKFKLEGKNNAVIIESLAGNGDFKNYIAGYEIKLDKWENLKKVQESIKKNIEMRPDSRGQLLQVSSILDNESELFAWLSFLDLNVIIIVILMLIIGVINVGSAMLVIIVVRTNLIGILKSMGAKNWSIRKIFLYQAGFLISKGLFYGNIIGLTLCWLQITFGIISLDPTIYYIDKVPIEITFFNWLLINLITFFVCIFSLIIPSYVVTRVSPSKAIRFN